MQRISILNPNLDPMAYPILFPNAEEGWSANIPRVKNTSQKDEEEEKQGRNRVSMKEFLSYRLSVRNDDSPILRSGKLCQQYVVDGYVRAEANDLNYIKTHQKELRADTYSCLMDHVSNEEVVGDSRIGKPIVLPSYFQGSPRNMHQNYQDAMAVVTKFGKPDLFVTITMNPKCTEVTENLKPHEKPENRPDLISRIFHLKLQRFLDDILNPEKGLFGKVIAYVYVIEFQKRGLPHAHMLLILHKDHKLKTEEDIDRVVKAEIPDEVQNPRLYEIVTRNMIHGPCGIHNPNSPCMVDGKCSKGYPKEFQDVTIGDVDGYPKYKRRKLPPVTIKGKQIDNSWVVPYNAYLCLKYNCHINVEICASVKSVKYLYKYVYKGHDCASLMIKEKSLLNEKDETEKYVNCRYVGKDEAMWRIFRLPMHKKSHTIVHLPVHLENQQTVCFVEGNEQSAAKKAKNQETKLTAWFKLNEADSEARQYKYWEIPSHYRWDESEKPYKWVKRVNRGDKAIGRMYTVSVKDQERYFLRLLLTHETGATCWDDLRTSATDDDIIVNTTFREAAKAKGYLMDDSIWQDTLDDAKTYAMPRQMRQLFAYICAFGEPSDALALWNDNKEDMIEDYCNKLHRGSPVCQNCEDYALGDLKEPLLFCP